LLNQPRHLNLDLIQAVNSEGEDLMPQAEATRAGWDQARDTLIAHIDAVRPDLDWDLRREIRDLLVLVADLVLILPSAERECQMEIRGAVKTLLGQITALKSQLED